MDDKAYLLFLKGALAERQKHYEPAGGLSVARLKSTPPAP